MRRAAGAAGVLLVLACATGGAIPPTARAAATCAVAPSWPWEGGSVQEPSVWRAGGEWHMLYKGGWTRAALGYATAPSPDGPWKKDRAPVLGLGRGGWPLSTHEPSVLVDRGMLYVYFSPTVDRRTPHGGDLMVAVGRDARHLHVQATPALRPAGRALGIVNVSVVRDGGRYRMMFESLVAGPTKWQIGYADSSTPLDFTVRTFPVSGLSRGGTFGGPDLHRTTGGWRLLYHAARAGSVPTDVYSATSTDLARWAPGPMLVAHSAGSDQAADPFEAGGRLFYDRVSNPRQVGEVCVS